MNFNEYQEAAKPFAVYPNVGKNFDYPLKGLFSEVGEVADKFKKIERDRGNVVTPTDVKEIGKEIGDCLWYLSALCNELGLSFSDVAEGNIKKLQKRKEDNLLHGSGDNR